MQEYELVAKVKVKAEDKNDALLRGLKILRDDEAYLRLGTISLIVNEIKKE